MMIDAKPSLWTRLSRNCLWLVAGCVAVVAGAALFSLNSVTDARTETATRDANGAFRPSDTQWANLTLAAVRQVAFRDEQATDGKIAINEDTTTPVFSPYSGRVTGLIAKPGD
jgi:cobalt-zinc-cadmium efflux system membrane fusion protein